ncbi:MAG TPA: GntR family transcriptional regulator, partial [Chloroflexota bacterium]
MPLPLYYRVEQDLRRALDQGTYRAGDRLPNEDNLARTLGVSRATVRTALKRLEEDGVIVRLRARGTFVRPRPQEAHIVERHLGDLLSFEEDILRAGLIPEVEVLSSEWVPPAAWASQALRSSATEQLFHVRRVGRAGGEPLWVESRYFASHVGPLLARRLLNTASLTRLVQRVCGVRVASSHVSVHAEAASEHIARLLHRPTGSPVLVCSFAFYDQQQLPLEAARAVYPADRYALSVDLSTTPST